MLLLMCLVLFTLVAGRSDAADIRRVDITMKHDWAEATKYILEVRMNRSISGGWRMALLFTKPVARLEMWRAVRLGGNNERTLHSIKNMYFNANLAKGELLTFALVVYKVKRGETRANVTGIFLPGKVVPTFSPVHTEESGQVQGNTTTGAPTAPVSPSPAPSASAFPTSSSTSGPTSRPTLTPGCPSFKPVAPGPIARYNYDELLHKSILFYEAQRSGKLPANNRVLWRKDSALGDRGENGEDLSGGWYDAGDYVKFGFPMAYSVTVLAWGLVEYHDAYQAAGALDNMLDSIKWPLDYFLKAHVEKFELYGQVGDANADHAYWGRPEDQVLARPAFKITHSQPGSDLAAETAAALAAASIAFRQTQPLYSQELVAHAVDLFEFAESYRGKYSDSIRAAAEFYPSSSYEDELSWAAVWLYRATSKTAYRDKAVAHYARFGVQPEVKVFNWDDKRAGVQLLLAKLTGNQTYATDIRQFLDGWLRDARYTPGGLAWRGPSASTSLAANTAFLALVAADLQINPNAYRMFAVQQIHYMLGDGGGQSFVVGFGANSPQRPRHRASSCPLAPVPCTWDDHNELGPNPHALLGALVSGPDPTDAYTDDRTDAMMNHVAVHRNAGFQSAVAGLKRLRMMGRF